MTHRTWVKQQAGDWRYLADDGSRIGAVVFQDIDGKRVWYSVSSQLEHGPEEGSLTTCKRRLEALWTGRP